MPKSNTFRKSYSSVHPVEELQDVMEGPAVADPEVEELDGVG
jgi:hypothetical protein